MTIEITDDDINEFLETYNLVNPNGQLVLDDTRKAAIKSWQDVKACPGSGKTTLIACKLIMLAKKWNDKYKGICVLTHTNVACDEIKARLENDKYGAKLLSYPHFIGTIQEFVNTFIGVPLLRSQGIKVKLLSTLELVNFVQNDWGSKKFICLKNNKKYWANYWFKPMGVRAKILLDDFRFEFADERLCIKQKFIGNTP